MSAQGRDGDERIARHEAFARADPDNALIWISLGDLYHRAGRLDEATASFERALVAAPESRVATSRLAQVMLSRRDFAGAEHALRGLLDAGETAPALFHDLGIALLHQGRFDEALDALARLDETRAPSVLFYRAVAHHQLGETERALESARAWAARAPSDAAEGYVALLEFDHGDLASARPRAEAVLERDPGNADAAVVIGTWLAEQQERERAEQLFQGVIAREPDNVRGWLGLGLVHLHRRDFGAGLAALERARALLPGHAGTLTTIGWAKFLDRDVEGAEAAFREAVRLDRNFGEAHGGLAVVLAVEGRRQEASAEIRRARGLGGLFGHAYAQSILSMLEGDPEGASRVLEPVLERRIRPDAPTLLEAVQLFARREAARVDATPRPPEGG